MLTFDDERPDHIRIAMRIDNGNCAHITEASLVELRPDVLRETAAIDFKMYKRSGSSELLTSEMKRVAEERNKILHQAIGCDATIAQFAIEVLDSLLLELLPKLVNSRGLTIDVIGLVHDGVPLQENESVAGNEIGGVDAS